MPAFAVPRQDQPKKVVCVHAQLSFPNRLNCILYKLWQLILVLISRIRDNTCDAPALHLVMLRYCSPAFYQTHSEIRTFTDAASISRIMFEQAPIDLRRHANQFLQKRQIAFSWCFKHFRKSETISKSRCFYKPKKFGKSTSNNLVTRRPMIKSVSNKQSGEIGEHSSLCKKTDSSVLDQEIWHMKKPRFTNKSLVNYSSNSWIS